MSFIILWEVPQPEEIKIDPNTNLFKRYDFLKNPIMKKSF